MTTTKILSNLYTHKLIKQIISCINKREKLIDAALIYEKILETLYVKKKKLFFFLIFKNIFHKSGIKTFLSKIFH